MDESRKQFEAEIEHSYGEAFLVLDDDGDYANWITADLWEFWVKSRAALDIELTPACWRTYYPDTDEHQYRAHSESGPESCARRIASEIGGYVVPVYHGKPQNCAAGIKVKE